MHPEPPTPASRGLFITFEGLDGSGKTTQIQRAVAWLSERNLAHIVTRQPGGTPLGDKIRAMLLDSRSTGLAPLTELAMMFADRAQAIQEIVAPALAAGQIVLCDRFTDSTEAYQGGGRQLGSKLVLDLHRLLCANLQPDLTILLLPSLEASLRRARRRNSRQFQATGHDENRFEREQSDFFARVHGQYRAIATRDPVRVVVIDGDLSIEEVHQRVILALETRLGRTGYVVPGV